jgi:hypothetical protein
MNTAPFHQPGATAHPHRPRAEAVAGTADQPERLPTLAASLAIWVLLIVVGVMILISMVTRHG